MGNSLIAKKEASSHLRKLCPGLFFAGCHMLAAMLLPLHAAMHKQIWSLLARTQQSVDFAHHLPRRQSNTWEIGG
jgi:hypothetical protein